MFAVPSLRWNWLCETAVYSVLCCTLSKHRCRRFLTLMFSRPVGGWYRYKFSVIKSLSGDYCLILAQQCEVYDFFMLFEFHSKCTKPKGRKTATLALFLTCLDVGETCMWAAKRENDLWTLYDAWCICCIGIFILFVKDVTRVKFLQDRLDF